MSAFATMRIRHLLVLLLVCALSQSVFAAAPRVFLLDGDRLEQSRKRIQQGDTALTPALQKLKHDADQAMALGPFSVMDKEVTPQSGDKHDYMSQAPYFWPN